MLWVGDAVAATGFARCTHAACNVLHKLGHEVAVLGINYYGDPHDLPYPIHPSVQPLDGGRDAFGVSRLPRMVERFEPDVVVILQDPWNYEPYFGHLDGFFAKRAEQNQRAEPEPLPPVVGWVAVDAKNQQGEPLNRCAHVVTWTEFGRDELRRGGYEGTSDVVPLGVDHEVFRPVDRRAARERVLPAEHWDSFCVGVVGRNQHRKRLDLSIQAFADFVRRARADDARLLIHSAPTGETGCDLRAVARFHGVADRVLVVHPPLGTGFSEEQMALEYGVMDAHLTTTQGEGWGLCTLEAMACGVPCIVPDWSALGEWAAGAAIAVPCSSTGLNAPLNAAPYTVGGVPDREATCEALVRLYEDAELRQEHSRRGTELARRYSWERTGEAMAAALERVVERERREVAA